MNLHLTSRLTGLFILPAVFLLPACAAFQSGETVIKHDEKSPPNEIDVPVTGTYALFAADDVEPKLTVRVEQGDPIGFRRDDSSGQLLAVAGDRSYPIDIDGSYYWRRH